MHNDLIFIAVLLSVYECLNLHSNYNYTYVSETALISEPIRLPVKLMSHRAKNTHWPKLMEMETLKKHELHDTDYKIEYQHLSKFEQELIYNMEPPSSVFQFEKLTIENYRLLEIRPFQITINNPSQRFKFCINEVLIDTVEVKRVEDRIKLPHCIRPGNKAHFNFTLYAKSIQPQYVRANVYFIIEIFDEKQLVDQKIYSRRIYATVTANHLRLEPSYFTNCPSNGQLKIKNYQKFEIIIRIDHKKKIKTIDGVHIHGEVYIAPTQSIVLELQGKNSRFSIFTTSLQDEIMFPMLLTEVICQQQLNLDFYNIGILTEEKMIVQVPISISNYINKTFVIQEIAVEATSQAVEVELWENYNGIILPYQKNLLAGFMRIYSRKKPEKRSIIEVSIKYSFGNDNKTSKMEYIYCEIRQPISVGQKRFIDVTKLDRNQKSETSSSKLIQNRMPIRNNLNFPIYLIRIFLDENIFQISWLQDRRNFIYPNHNREQFLFSYIGPLQITLSSLKYIVFLEFNGHIYIPLEIVVYDHTLQCLYDNLPMKCSNITTLDYGYFKDKKIKSKQIVLRNWNPESKNIKLGIGEKNIEKYGINATLRVYGPLPNYESIIRKTEYTLEYYLKGQHFLVVNIDVELLTNATSAQIPFRILSQSEDIKSIIKIRVQDGTITLIPQVIQLQNAFEKTIDYLNLESTFSQSYQIRRIQTNLSNLMVYSNNFSEIHKNQRVGMAIVYEPYINSFNLTYQDWNKEQFFLHLIKNLQKGYQSPRYIYVKIKLTTTTDLEVNSTVIIHNDLPNLILNSGKTQDRFYTYQMAILKRNRKCSFSNYRRLQNRHCYRQDERLQYQTRFRIKNHFPGPMRYRIYLLSEFKHKNLHQYAQQLKIYKTQRKYECFFCLSNEAKLKYSIYASNIKNAFRLQALPEELSIQVNENMYEVYNLSRSRVNVEHQHFDKYVKAGYRYCYKFLHTMYIKRLIDIEILNHLLEKEDYDKFNKFLKNQLKHYENYNFDESFDELYQSISLQFQKICKNNLSLMIYKFCHFIKISIKDVQVKIKGQEEKARITGQAYIMQSGQEHEVVFQVINPIENQYNFYLILVNNYTSYQTYAIKLMLIEPKLQIQYIYLDSYYKIYKKEFQNDYFNDYLLDRQLVGSNKKSLIPIYVTNYDYNEVQGYISGRRVVELVNNADIDIELNHIGIQSQEYTCTYKGLVITGLNCGEYEVYNSIFQQENNLYEDKNEKNKKFIIHEPFILKSYQRYNLTINFKFSLFGKDNSHKFQAFPQNKLLHTINLYLYDSKNYFYNLTIVFKIGDKNLRKILLKDEESKYNKSLFGYLFVNFISFAFVCLIVIKIKNEQLKEDKKEGIDDKNRHVEIMKGKLLLQNGKNIIHESIYSSKIGTKISKRQYCKPVQIVSDDILLGFKELKNKQLKKFFNEFEESEIIPKNFEVDRHNLSISHSISYDQEEFININGSSIINEDSHSSSDKLVSGSEVDSNKNIDQDSWYDFNSSVKKTQKIQEKEKEKSDAEEEYYNVFNSGLPLKKTDRENSFPFLQKTRVEKNERGKAKYD